MATAAKRATIYLESNLHKALRLKAVETSRSVSELVNEAVRVSLSEDAGEPLISHDEMIKRLKERRSRK